jgi:hypothetical protein
MAEHHKQVDLRAGILSGRTIGCRRDFLSRSVVERPPVNGSDQGDFGHCQ